MHDCMVFCSGTRISAQTTEELDMEPTGPQPLIVNGESDRKAFWSEMQLLAVTGMERPECLTLEDIRRLCRVTVIGLAKRDEGGT